MSLIVGIPACCKDVNDEPQYATPTRYVRALMGVAGAIPVLLPPVGEAMLAILDRLDGLLLSGSPSNVHPELYGVAESLTPDQHDPLPRRHHAAAGARGAAARHAAARDLPRHPGAERGAGRHAAPAGAPARGPARPPGRRRRARPQFRLKHNVQVSGQLAAHRGQRRRHGELAARAGDRPAGGRAGGRGGGRRRHDRGGARARREGVCVRRAVPSRVALRDRCRRAGRSSPRSARHAGPIVQQGTALRPNTSGRPDVDALPHGWQLLRSPLRRRRRPGRTGAGHRGHRRDAAASLGARVQAGSDRRRARWSCWSRPRQSAPTSSNLQTWSVVAVEDPARRERLSAACRQPGLHPAGAVVPGVDRRPVAARAAGAANGRPLEGLEFLELFMVALIDAALAAQNALVAAESLGLGTVYVGALRNHPAEVAAELGLPPNAFAAFGLAVGHPDPAVPPRSSPGCRRRWCCIGSVIARRVRRASSSGMTAPCRSFPRRTGWGGAAGSAACSAAWARQRA